MKFITFTQLDGKDCFIDIHKIQSVNEEGSQTKIYFSNSDYQVVKEKPREVFAMLENYHVN